MTASVHFEIHVVDPERAIAFYSGLFGWDIVKTPAEWDYWLIAAEGIGMGKPISGAMLPRRGVMPDQGSPPRGAVISMAVADVDDRYAWALGHGGGEAMAPFDIPGVGRVAYCEDGQGNIFGMVQHAT